MLRGGGSRRGWGRGGGDVMGRTRVVVMVWWGGGYGDCILCVSSAVGLGRYVLCDCVCVCVFVWMSLFVGCVIICMHNQSVSFVLFIYSGA